MEFGLDDPLRGSRARGWREKRKYWASERADHESLCPLRPSDKEDLDNTASEEEVDELEMFEYNDLSFSG